MRRPTVPCARPGGSPRWLVVVAGEPVPRVARTAAAADRWARNLARERGEPVVILSPNGEPATVRPEST